MFQAGLVGEISGVGADQVVGDGDLVVVEVAGGMVDAIAHGISADAGFGVAEETMGDAVGESGQGFSDAFEGVRNFEATIIGDDWFETVELGGQEELAGLVEGCCKLRV